MFDYIYSRLYLKRILCLCCTGIELVIEARAAAAHGRREVAAVQVVLVHSEHQVDVHDLRSTVTHEPRLLHHGRLHEMVLVRQHFKLILGMHG